MKFNCGAKRDNEKKIEELEKQNKILLELANNNATALKDNANVAKKSVSAMSYTLKHFDNAPPMGLLEDEQFNKMSKLLMYDLKGKRKTECSIEEVILYHHKQNTLHGILGDLIVKVYKKKNPEKQSVWSSDVSRLTFIVKDIIGKSKKSKWITDKKGIHFTEAIIDPLLEKIKDLLIEYNDECGEFVKKMGTKVELSNREEELIRRTYKKNL